jgi:hypothetical protein
MPTAVARRRGMCCVFKEAKERTAISDADCSPSS